MNGTTDVSDGPIGPQAPAPLAGPAVPKGVTRVDPAALLAQAAEAKADELTYGRQLALLPLKQSDTLGHLALALSKAQGQITNAVKQTLNTYFKSQYADLGSTWDACRKALSDNELAVIQPVTSSGRAVIVTTRLIHSSGEWIESAILIMAAQDTAQAVGSTITYARRYGLAAMVGVAAADDDGEAASRILAEGVKQDPGRTALQASAAGLEGSGKVAQPPSAAVAAVDVSQAAPSAGTSAPPKIAGPARPVGTTAPPPPGMKPPQRAPGS